MYVIYVQRNGSTVKEYVIYGIEMFSNAILMLMYPDSWILVRCLCLGNSHIFFDNFSDESYNFVINRSVSEII